MFLKANSDTHSFTWRNFYLLHCHIDRAWCLAQCSVGRCSQWVRVISCYFVTIQGSQDHECEKLCFFLLTWNTVFSAQHNKGRQDCTLPPSDDTRQGVKSSRMNKYHCSCCWNDRCGFNFNVLLYVSMYRAHPSFSGERVMMPGCSLNIKVVLTLAVLTPQPNAFPPWNQSEPFFFPSDLKQIVSGVHAEYCWKKVHGNQDNEAGIGCLSEDWFYILSRSSVPWSILGIFFFVFFGFANRWGSGKLLLVYDNCPTS